MENIENLLLKSGIEIETEPPDSGPTESGLPRFASVDEMVRSLRPTEPVHCLHPEALDASAALFLEHFSGATFYAVKVNPDPYVLRRLYAAGVRHFDVASLPEIKLVRDLFPDAHLAYMHTIKSRESIRAAYFEYGVRDFAVDTFEELHKIFEETHSASDLSIHVRLGLPKGSALHELSAKFGATPDEAVSLLRDANAVAHKVGLCFHVGSQTMSPQSFADALETAGKVIRESGVTLDVLDVGGGFPACYPGMETGPLTAFFAVIRDSIAKLNLPETCEIWGEPGRAMVAAAETLVVRVELRKGNMLYINDGAYGSLFDAGWIKWSFPARLVRPSAAPRRRPRKDAPALQPFGFYGPTCDSLDVMPGPFYLPADICEGEWIAISQHGAYGKSIQTRFNGFVSDFQVEIVAGTQAAKRRRAKPQTSFEVREQ